VKRISLAPSVYIFLVYEDRYRAIGIPDLTNKIETNSVQRSDQVCGTW
jgi:hypothetical protein